MNSNRSISRVYSLFFILVLLLALTLSNLDVMTAHAAGIRYAAPGGTGDCSSWDNACNLQTALTGALSGDEIWAATGMYKPTTGTDRTATFQLMDGVAIYGGFDGAETARDQRDPASNLTTLSGDLNGDDVGFTNNSENVYHVVTGADNAILDGFTITSGNANGTNPPNDGGGGIYNDHSSPTITNVTFSENTATSRGGGMYTSYPSSPTLTNVTFSDNSAGSGGGMYSQNGFTMLTNVTFSGNTAGFGGGIENNNANSILTNVTFSDNSATHQGGGMYNYSTVCSNPGCMSLSPELTNVTFSGNSATYQGGGMYNTSPACSSMGCMSLNSPILTNVTFSGNSAQQGSGIFNDHSFPQVRNTILWNNSASTPGEQIHNINNSAPVISDSVVQYGCPQGSKCSKIIIADPRLGALGNYDGFTQTIPLLIGSSAIDMGGDATCAIIDQRGISRPQGSHCDIGAYEYEFGPISIYYVKSVAIGTGDCQSWDNACTLQTALTTTISGDEIWVAAGTYKPTTGTDRTATFQLKDGVALYGGFAGTETTRTQRSPVINLTNLSGNIGTAGDNSDNSYHVVTGATGATLDGFTITAGNANGTSNNNAGAGMYNASSNPIVANVIFIGNSGVIGGGIYNTSSSPTLTNISFIGNSAQLGGGMHNNNSDPTLTNITLTDNSANEIGGGIYNDHSNPMLAHVTISGNSALSGGGIGNYYSIPQIRNTIFWGNTTSIAGDQMYNDSSIPVVSDSVIQDGYAGGTNIIIGDPRLSTLGNYGGSTKTIPILPGSSALDTGNDNYCVATDQRGIVRPQGTHCDIGAYEYDYTGIGIYFVKSVAIGTGDCQSWDNACTLQTALTTTISGDEIWVAAGTYKPSTGTDRNATFQLKDGVALYGGFAGTETARDQRDPASNLTTLSGDLSGDDVGFTNNSENVYHVVTGAHNATLDGFTITAGNANGTSNELYGGGMYNASSNPILTNVTFSGNSTALYGGGLYGGGTLTNVTFSGNSAGHSGGGMHNGSSNSTLTNVTFSGNSATLRGGGMFDLQSSTLTNVTFSENSAGTSGGGMHNHDNNPTLMNVTFSGNSAQHGGGMYNQGSPTLTNVTFSGNSAQYGGGMRNEGGNPTLMNVTFNDNLATLHGGGMNNHLSSSPVLTNVTFSNNSAVLGGGVYSDTSCNPILTNVTFNGNSAQYGGGIYNTQNSSPQIRNTILWGNTDSTAGAQIYNNDTASSPAVSYSVVQNGYAAGVTNIITTDPMLGTLGNYGGFTQTIPLLEGSSAIDAGNDAICPLTDQRGVSRPQGAHCDIGAFEFVETTAVFTIFLPLILR